jgi:hypothetical protein
MGRGIEFLNYIFFVEIFVGGKNFLWVLKFLHKNSFVDVNFCRWGKFSVDL